jgi:drug/metabolite transporter (DMT)-like permease
MKSRNDRTSALAGVHAAVLLFGIAGLFGKWLALHPLWLVLGRTAIAAAALGLFRLLLRDRWPAFDARLLASGAVLALHWVAFFAAIQTADVATGLLGYASFPLFVLILERAMLDRRWTRREALTAVLVTLGLVLLVPELSLANRVVQGLAWGIVSGFTFALLTVMNRRRMATRLAMDVAFWQDAWAAVVLLPIAFLGAPTPHITARDVALLLVLGVVCTAVAHTLFILSLKSLSAHTASVVAALEPVYGIVLAVLLLQEVPGVRTIAGAALIVGAAMISTWHGRVGLPYSTRLSE